MRPSAISRPHSDKHQERKHHTALPFLFAAAGWLLASATRAAGKAAGFLAVDPEMAHKALAWGANFVAVGVDTNLYTRALDKRLAMFKPVAEQAEGKGSY